MLMARLLGVKTVLLYNDRVTLFGHTLDQILQTCSGDLVV